MELQKSLLETWKFFSRFFNHWLRMTSIPLIVDTIEWKQLRCIYLKNKTFFLNYFLHFPNLH